jgi:hypothetical protein
MVVAAREVGGVGEREAGDRLQVGERRVASEESGQAGRRLPGSSLAPPRARSTAEGEREQRERGHEQRERPERDSTVLTAAGD